MFAIAQPAVGVPALIAVAAMTYFNAAIQDWWGSDGFGGRRFDGTIPMFCLGAAAFVTYAAACHPTSSAAGRHRGRIASGRLESDADGRGK